jgi:hypothetical protein
MVSQEQEPRIAEIWDLKRQEAGTSQKVARIELLKPNGEKLQSHNFPGSGAVLCWVDFDRDGQKEFCVSPRRGKEGPTQIHYIDRRGVKLVSVDSPHVDSMGEFRRKNKPPYLAILHRKPKVLRILDQQLKTVWSWDCPGLGQMQVRDFDGDGGSEIIIRIGKTGQILVLNPPL